jgi:hypothetical protein
VSLSLLIEHGEAGGASIMLAENHDSVSHGEQSLVDAVTMVLPWAGQVGKGLLSIETRSPVGESGRFNGCSVVLHCCADRFGALVVKTGWVGKDALTVSLRYVTGNSSVGLQC